MRARPPVAKMAIAFAIAASVSGCATHAWPWSKKAEVAAASCFWMTQDGSSWEAQSHVPSKDACFELDSCSGGLGFSGGGCYKWATAADAEGQAW